MSGAGTHVLGAVSFGPASSVEDSMAASIIRLECENDELRAEAAMLREERAILQKQFAGVIEGGQRHCDSEAYATPSDLSPRTTLSGGGERLNPRIPGSQPGAVRRRTRSVDEGREADAHHDSRGRVRPAQSIRGVAMEELREEVRHKYEADRVGGHEWGNI